MEKKASAYFRLLETTFTEEEMDRLKQQPHFQKAVAAMRSFGEFDRVCAIGRRLLAKKQRVVHLHGTVSHVPRNSTVPQSTVIRVSMATPDQATTKSHHRDHR